MFYSIFSVLLCGALWLWELSWSLSIRVLPGASTEEGSWAWGAMEESEQFTGDGPGVAGEPWQHGKWVPFSSAGETGAQESLCCARERTALLVGPHSGGGWKVFKLLLIALLERMRETVVVLWEGLVLEAFCIDEFSPPHYTKFRDGEASAYLVLRDAVC